MKNKSKPLLKRYEIALAAYLDGSAVSDLGVARKLGGSAVKIGMETLDLARLHEQVMLVLLDGKPPALKLSMTARGRAFFAEVMTRIEENRLGAREATAHLKTMIETLIRRTKELATSNEELKNEVNQRRQVEESLRTSETTTSQLLEKSRQMQDELRQLSRRLLTVQEEERKRISRELHDVIAQTLTGINLRLAALKAQTSANAREFHQKIAITQRLVVKSVEIVHRFARDLRPAVLDDLGLIPALKSYMTTFLEQTGIRVAFVAFAGIEKLDGAAKTVLYRVAQEALTNISHHAKASHVKMSIRDTNEKIVMLIQDDGVGFSVDHMLNTQHSNRLGLLGMRERVEMINGTFCVKSEVGKGTLVTVEIPRESSQLKKPHAAKTTNSDIECP
jgi:signal transduction histidine kinase